LSGTSAFASVSKEAEGVIDFVGKGCFDSELLLSTSFEANGAGLGFFVAGLGAVFASFVSESARDGDAMALLFRGTLLGDGCIKPPGPYRNPLAGTLSDGASTFESSFFDNGSVTTSSGASFEEIVLATAGVVVSDFSTDFDGATDEADIWAAFSSAFDVLKSDSAC
jgi:hypothetical protein